jgi:hypothetical protein
MRRAVDQPLRNEPGRWFVDVRLRAAIRAGGCLAPDRSEGFHTADDTCAQRHVAAGTPCVSPGGDRKPAAAGHPTRGEHERAMPSRCHGSGRPRGRGARCQAGLGWGSGPRALPQAARLTASPATVVAMNGGCARTTRSAYASAHSSQRDAELEQATIKAPTRSPVRTSASR